jgi:hypothetical protein
MARHKYVHEKGEPKSKLRKLAVPIALFCIFIYAAQWAFRFQRGNLRGNLAAGIIFAGAAAFLWILKPRKNRHKG